MGLFYSAQNVDSSNQTALLLPFVLGFTMTYPVTYTTLLQNLYISDAPYETNSIGRLDEAWD
jgi:hypothetical protein